MEGRGECYIDVRNYLRSNNLSLNGPIIVSLVDKYAPLRLGSAASLSDTQLMDVLGDGFGQFLLSDKRAKKNICVMCNHPVHSYGSQFLTHCKIHLKESDGVQQVLVVFDGDW